MKIIDAHVHLVEIIAGFCRRGELRAIGNGEARWANGETMKLIPEGYGEKDFTAEALIRLMDENNVDKAVLMQGSMYGFQNEYTWEICKKYRERFIGACTFDPYANNSKQLFERFINEMGFKIIKFEMSSGGGLMGYHNRFEIDGREMDNIWRKASEAGITVVLDIGDSTMESYQPDAVRRIALKYPNLKIIVCHLLAPIQGKEERLKKDLEILNLPNIWFDLAALPSILAPDKYPFLSAQNCIKIAKEILGTSKLIWGSDIPMTATINPYEQLIRYIAESNIFNEKELQMVFHDNASNVYFN